MPNNNEKNNEGLNAVSLGSIEASEPVETLNVDPVSEIPPVTQGASDIPPVEPVSYDIPEPINTTPVFNEVGTVPPINNQPTSIPPVIEEEPKKKKKGNKLIFVMIIVLCIAAVGVGVYILLNISNEPSVVVTPREVTIEVGSEVSSNIDDYATFSGIASSSCSLDTSSITSTEEVGAIYNFNITCNGVTYTGTATVVDTTDPVVELRDVTVEVGGSVAEEDFIASCTDASGCSYEFSDSEALSGYLESANDYHVDIIVRDEYDNEVVVTANLHVTSEDVPDLYLSCTASSEEVRLPIVANILEGTIIRTYTFTFDSESEYNTFKENNQDSDTVTYNNVTGTPSFSDEELTLTLTRRLTKTELDQEAGSTLPTGYGELRNYYRNLGYTCTFIQP